MKRIVITIFLTNILYANLSTIVSILPEKIFVKAIGGNRVTVSLMVLPSNSPHTYEPKPSQMKKVSQAQLYFAIGVGFEKIWLPKFKNLNSNINIIDLSQGIEKLPMTTGHLHEDIHHHEKEGELDPHIWLSPTNIAKMAEHIYTALSQADPSNQAYYQKNLKIFLATVQATDKKIQKILSVKPKGTAFMVVHPSWGYFAKAYGLTQLPIEIEGKEPKPKELIMLIKKAKRKKVHAIFTQPELSDNTAKVIAHELHISLIKISPLASDWSTNLIRIAKAIVGEE
ncbi:MAG: zinc ABC transporter substrate-binding protein [Sulfurovum sp.]|nr:zinc ABC transporter substrate-binding protein [Sulfurovum sp.]